MKDYKYLIHSKEVLAQKKFNKRMTLVFSITGIVMGFFAIWLFINTLFQGV